MRAGTKTRTWRDGRGHARGDEGSTDKERERGGVTSARTACCCPPERGCRSRSPRCGVGETLLGGTLSRAPRDGTHPFISDTPPPPPPPPPPAHRPRTVGGHRRPLQAAAAGQWRPATRHPGGAESKGGAGAEGGRGSRLGGWAGGALNHPAQGRPRARAREIHQAVRSTAERKCRPHTTAGGDTPPVGPGDGATNAPRPHPPAPPSRAHRVSVTPRGGGSPALWIRTRRGSTRQPCPPPLRGAEGLVGGGRVWVAEGEQRPVWVGGGGGMQVLGEPAYPGHRSRAQGGTRGAETGPTREESSPARGRACGRAPTV